MNGTGAVRPVAPRRPQPREARTVVLPQPAPAPDRRGVAYGVAAFLCVAALGAAAGYAYLLRHGAFAADAVPIERASVVVATPVAAEPAQAKPLEPVAEPAQVQVVADTVTPATDAGAGASAPAAAAQPAPVPATAPPPAAASPQAETAKAAAPVQPVPAAPPVQPPAQRKRRLAQPSAEPTEDPVVTAKGELVLLIRPWAKVEVDGQEVGVTPLNEPLMLAAGEHRVRLINPDLGKDVTRTVRITASGREVLKELLDE